jgi:hypothetical protein
MAKQLFTNNAATLMSGTLSIGGTTLNVSTGTGALFPAISGSDYYLLTIFEKDGFGVEMNHEIVKVTARVADSMTIERDYEGIVGVVGGNAYDGVSNTVYVSLRWTAGCAEGLQGYTDAVADITTAEVHAATSKATPVDADELPLIDSEASNVLKKLTWANIKATAKTYFDTLYARLGTANTFTADQTIQGNLTFDGTGRRIIGDFSTATYADRVAVQTSVTNGITNLFFIPNGTGVSSAVTVANASNLTNCSHGQLSISTADVRITSGILGTGTYLPMTLYAGGAERLHISTSGNVGIGGSSSGAVLYLRKSLDSTVNICQLIQPQISGTVSETTGVYYQIRADADAAVTTANCFYAVTPNITSGGTVGTAFGFRVNSGFSVATTNYGFHSAIPAATGRYNFYAAGTAENYFAGNTSFGGSVLLTSANGIGYGTGAGGTVTQATSKTTTVTLNKPTGLITMDGAALAAGATATFALSNSIIASDDTVIVHRDSGGTNDAYQIWTDAVFTGSSRISVKNISAGSLSEAVVIRFTVIKSVSS